MNSEEFANALGADIVRFGGFLRCSKCGVSQDLGDTGKYFETGWPKHCGYTMTWWTENQITSGEAPQRSLRPGQP